MDDRAPPILQVQDLHVYYGHAHALQGVNLTLDHGVLGVVGRNGMGKSTLCNTIMGLTKAARGNIKIDGTDVLGLTPNRIVHQGVAYVPQGRRVWPSLSVDEHLRLAARDSKKDASWTIKRVYETFPSLENRKRNGGGQLSGGEQQMLAIGRALLGNPRLLIMDEPTEGLAPLIVQQVTDMLSRLSADGEISVLLIEQNLGVATDVAERIGIMVNGRLVREISAAELANDLELQQRLLGVHSADEEEEFETHDPEPEAVADAPSAVFRVRRAIDPDSDAEAPGASPVYVAAQAPTRWSQNVTPETSTGAASDVADSVLAGDGRIATIGDTASPAQDMSGAAQTGRMGSSERLSVAQLTGRTAYVCGTFDTKARDLGFIRNRLERCGMNVRTVDLSTSGRPSPADVGPQEVARHHPRGPSAVFTDDRGSAVAAMAEAFAIYLPRQRDIGGVISAGGSGGTSLATPAMQRLSIGVPKVMVSTVASGDVTRYVGPADITMMYSVTDVSGINRISSRVLANAANALAGMIANMENDGEPDTAKPAVALTMFGVTTPCVQMMAKALEEDFDTLIFHATGTGGRAMEKLADSRLLAGVIDATTTEIADLHVGGVFSAGEGRLDAFERSRTPYVGSCGALDMVNWGPEDTVPERFRGRNLYRHNPQVTLMRTTPEENAWMGRFIAEKLNKCEGPVRFLIPEGGVSMLDAPGQPFHDTAADRALFEAIAQHLRVTKNRQLIRRPENINDPAFAEALVANFLEIADVNQTTQDAIHARLSA